ncbi:MAG: DNA polymerase III subunit alpha [Ignavibacteriae bacterium]|nr:DNA polymerase III subunit alpha [Ignavibacteriota bacterium]
MPHEFIHLHNHTHYSLLDAIATVDGLVQAAVDNKMKAVALTDHGVMYGAMEFYKKCRKNDIKPIIGCEVYVAQSGSRLERGKKNDTSDEVRSENSDGLSSTNINYAHLILLAKDEVGYRNLLKLVSIGHTEGFYYKPRIDLEVLSQYNQGLVATSACAGGVISCYITRNDMDMARKMVGQYKDIFGDDFYLEIQNHLTIDAEQKVLEWMPKLAKEFGLKLIVTNDCHYIKPEHAIAHNIYLHISAKQSKVQDSYEILNNLRYGTDQVYFKSAKEMCELFRDYPDAIKSTLEVTEKCNLDLDLSKNHMPRFEIPKEDETEDLDEYLKKLSYEGLKKRIKNPGKDEHDRLNYELSVIEKMEFAGYFLIVQDFIRAAKEKGILVGPGRGSAAGSLVCYALGITDVNPLEYNLLFERFLNPERISMPDIDVDFQDDRRDEIIQYAKEKFGDNSVAQIITFNKLAPRGVLKDVGRVLNFPFNEINDLTKHIPIVFGKVTPLTRCMDEVEDFKNYFKKSPPDLKDERKKLYEYSQVLENLNKNSSIHASGVVIAPSDVVDYVPLSKVTGEEDVFCTQYDMNQLEDAGLIKMDFLGLKELKVIGRTLDLVNNRHNTDLTVDKIPLDDEKTYELFGSGSTVGIFQFSKSKMREYLAKMKPKNINDLAAMNALYRPGPMKLIPDFIEKRFGRKEVTYLHPLMENSLKETYGIIVFQEQVMQIAREVAGFTMAQADNMRKAMGKKIKAMMDEVKVHFIKGAEENGVPKKTAEQIFSLILDFADYGFNKSHGVAYSILAFYTAYLKTHYPVEFLAVSMACRKDSETELQELAFECKKMNVDLLSPNINSGSVDFTVKYLDEGDKVGEIIYGLSAIKNVGEKAVQNIVEEREENGPYKSFVDFLKRVDLRLVNRKTLEGLIFAGAFDDIEPNRNKLYSNLERTVAYAQRYKTLPESQGQEGLFTMGKGGNEYEDSFILGDAPEFEKVEKYIREKSAIGFYLTGHPLENYKEEISLFTNLDFGVDVNELDFNSLGTVKVCGVISNFQPRISKRGKKFATFDLIDTYGSAECIAFESIIVQSGNFLKNDSVVYVTGRADENGDSIKLVIEDIFPMTQLRERLGSYALIKLNDKEDDVFEKLEKIKSVVSEYPGNCFLYFRVKNNGSYQDWKSREFKLKLSEDLISNLKEIVGESNLEIN